MEYMWPLVVCVITDNKVKNNKDPFHMRRNITLEKVVVSFLPLFK